MLFYIAMFGIHKSQPKSETAELRPPISYREKEDALDGALEDGLYHSLFSPVSIARGLGNGIKEGLFGNNRLRNSIHHPINPVTYAKELITSSEAILEKYRNAEKLIYDDLDQLNKNTSKLICNKLD